jgi:putative membrane protein
MDSWASLPNLLWGTLVLRPYVFAFLVVFLAAGVRDLGGARTVGLLVWGWAVAFVAEYASTRVGIPFGLYHYTGATAGAELYLSNVPFFDSLSFPFLAYASFCLARRVLGAAGDLRVATAGGFLMMLLDVVIDPLAVRGDRWFLGRVFYYDAAGVYFGVPLSNFAGWFLVGWILLGGYLWATRRTAGGARGGDKPGPGVGLYYAVLLFTLALTLWIGELGLLVVGILVHTGGFLLLYGLGAMRSAAPGGSRAASRLP